MGDTEILWQRIHEAFLAHSRHDPSPQAALDRIAQKCLGLSERRSFAASNCAVRATQISAAELSAIVVCHNRSEPKWNSGALVILHYEDRNYAVDGNNRINRWLKDGREGPFEAIIIKPINP